MANQKYIPYIPSMSIQFKRMQYIYCESETSSMVVTRADFMRLLEQQPCPMAQIYIDRDGGYVYLIPYRPERADAVTQMYLDMDAARQKRKREQEAIRAGKRQATLHLDQELNEDGLTFGDTIAVEDTPEDRLLTKERFIMHRAAFAALTESDREVLLGYIHAGYNARELARRLGKDPSGVTKRLKRAAQRLQENIEKNF